MVRDVARAAFGRVVLAAALDPDAMDLPLRGPLGLPRQFCIAPKWRDAALEAASLGVGSLFLVAIDQDRFAVPLRGLGCGDFFALWADDVDRQPGVFALASRDLLIYARDVLRVIERLAYHSVHLPRPIRLAPPIKRRLAARVHYHFLKI